MVGDKVEEAKWKGLCVNDHCQQMKGIMMESAQDICGMTKGPRRHKETRWWNVEVAEAVREKKIKYGGPPGKVIADDKGIKDSWKEYMDKLVNEENEWDHKTSAELKEEPADCIRMAEVNVLKKMKRHKAPGLSGLVAEMIQATGDIGTQWILDLCKG